MDRRVANRSMSAPPAISRRPDAISIVPKADGTLAGVLFGIEAADEPVKDLFRPGDSSLALLPPGTYRFANAPHDARLAALAFAFASYRFTRYRKGESTRHTAGASRRRRRRRPHAHYRRRDARPRSHQHAVERHGAGRAGRCRAGAGQETWRPSIDRDRWRCAGASNSRWFTPSAQVRARAAETDRFHLG